MGRKNKNRTKRGGRKMTELEEEPQMYPVEMREEKAREVRLQLALLGLGENFQAIKKLNIILDLWVKHNREHQEMLDLPFVEDKKLEIRLFNRKNRESKVILKHIPN